MGGGFAFVAEERGANMSPHHQSSSVALPSSFRGLSMSMSLTCVFFSVCLHVFSGLNSRFFMEVYSRELVAQPSCFYVDMPDVEWEVFQFQKIYDPGISSSATWQYKQEIKSVLFHRNKNGHPLVKKGYVVEDTYHLS